MKRNKRTDGVRRGEESDKVIKEGMVAGEEKWERRKCEGIRGQTRKGGDWWRKDGRECVKRQRKIRGDKGR